MMAMTQEELAQKTAHLNDLLEEKLGLRKGPLARRAARAGRRLPAYVRKSLHRLSQAQALMAHPKLAQQVNTAELQRSYAQACAHLQAIDPGARRKTAALRLAAGLAFNILALGALVLALLHWRRLL